MAGVPQTSSDTAPVLKYLSERNGEEELRGGMGVEEGGMAREEGEEMRKLGLDSKEYKLFQQHNALRFAIPPSLFSSLSLSVLLCVLLLCSSPLIFIRWSQFSP